VYVGSLDRKRRIEEMVEAVSLAAADLAVSLDIYGYGDRERRVRQAIEERGMTRVIAVHDAVHQAELFQRLSEHDIGLAYVPRVPYDSALPLKTLEYLACGLPVVATDTIGNRMVVQPGVNGLLVDEDPRAFGAGIRELATAAWWWSARQNARPSVESFDWESIVSHRLLPLYQALLG
jgi:glycosyltransferase involved in cell wall biosynthesis